MNPQAEQTNEINRLTNLVRNGGTNPQTPEGPVTKMDFKTIMYWLSISGSFTNITPEDIFNALSKNYTKPNLIVDLDTPSFFKNSVLDNNQLIQGHAFEEYSRAMNELEQLLDSPSLAERYRILTQGNIKPPVLNQLNQGRINNRFLINKSEGENTVRKAVEINKNIGAVFDQIIPALLSENPDNNYFNVCIRVEDDHNKQLDAQFRVNRLHHKTDSPKSQEFKSVDIDINQPITISDLIKDGIISVDQTSILSDEILNLPITKTYTLHYDDKNSRITTSDYIFANPSFRISYIIGPEIYDILKISEQTWIIDQMDQRMRAESSVPIRSKIDPSSHEYKLAEYLLPSEDDIRKLAVITDSLLKKVKITEKDVNLLHYLPDRYEGVSDRRFMDIWLSEFFASCGKVISPEDIYDLPSAGVINLLKLILETLLETTKKEAVIKFFSDSFMSKKFVKYVKSLINSDNENEVTKLIKKIGW